MLAPQSYWLFRKLCPHISHIPIRKEKVLNYYGALRCCMLGHSKLIHCFPLHWKLEDMQAGGSLFIIHSQRLDIVAGHGRSSQAGCDVRHEEIDERMLLTRHGNDRPRQHRTFGWYRVNANVYNRVGHSKSVIERRTLTVHDSCGQARGR